MKSEIIDRILSENRESLQKIIETARNNAVFQDVMSNIKEEFFINDSIHGISHNERVALLSCYIGIQEGLDIEELKLVLEAAKYHDIGRGYEGNHGKYSTIIIDRNKEYIFSDLNDNEINIIKALCHGHSVDDSRYEEIAKLYGIRNIDQFKKLLNIVKDADALDRVRLPRFGKLDEKYLRTETAHGMIELAENLYREYRNIQQEIPSEDKVTESKYTFNAELREQLLFDGENYYLLRSLNSADIDSLNNGNGIIPKIDNIGENIVQDVMAQIRMQHRKTNLISMSEDPNIVLTYDKSNLHRFALIKLSKEEIENSKKVFSAGEYLLGVIDSEIERIAKNAPERVREILDNVDRATSIDEIIRIINGADRQVPTSLVETEQQYLSNKEQLNQSKKIAKCKVLNYYGLMRGIAHDERGKLLDISEFTRIMRNGYSSSEWLYSGKISQDKIINIPQILIDSLALLKQAEFQGKDKEILKEIEQEVLRLAISGEEINQDNYRLEYFAHNDLKNDLTIDRAYEITNGQISYRDTNMQQIAIRSLAEMTLNKRKIIELLKEKLPNIDIEELLSGTHCINQEMITKQNNRGSQIGRNINFLISKYGYDFDEETSRQILENVEALTDEQLKNIVSQGINAQEISGLLIKTRENDERIQANKSKGLGSKYIAEAIVEGYNWKKDGNSLTIKERELLANALLRGVKTNNELYRLYESINKIQIGKNKFTQNDVFAIMINLAIDGKIGDISYVDLLKKDIREIQYILLDNQAELQTSVLPMTMDLLVGRGREISKLKRELIDLGIDKEFIESKDIKNIFLAKKVVEEYEFDFELNSQEKKSIIKCILSLAVLNINQGYHYYLSNLINDIERAGFTTKESYGIFINLAINRSLLGKDGFSYSELLQNANNCREGIEINKDDLDKHVSKTTITKAVGLQLDKIEKEAIIKQLEMIGISKSYLEGINIQNILFAKEIVDNYQFGRKLDDFEKCSLIISILDTENFKNNQNGKARSYLYSLIQNMEKLGLQTQEIYAIIINLSVNNKANKANEDNGISYTKLLTNADNSRKKLLSHIEEIERTVKEGTIEKAVENNLDEKNVETIIESLVNYGLSRKFLDNIDIRNIYMANKIVNDYIFDRDITLDEKRGIIYCLLNSSYLNKENGTCLLSSLLRNFEKSNLDMQSIYGCIINLAVNGKFLDNKGPTYSYLITNLDDCCSKIPDFISEKDTKVRNGIIQTAVFKENQNKSETIDFKSVRQKLISIGLPQDFIDNKDEKNIYEAIKIVQEYDFGRKLTDNEKKAIIFSILNITVLNKEASCYLSTVIKNFMLQELNEQEIYGIIINTAINGRATDEDGYSYQTILSNKEDVFKKIRQNKDKLNTKVSEITIEKAIEKSLSQKDIDDIKKELLKIGVSEDFLIEKDDRNIYMTKEVIEQYQFGSKLTDEQKVYLIESILSSKKLNKGKSIYLSTLMQKLEKMGLSKQEVLGAIINLGINNKLANSSKFSYNKLLSGNDELFPELSKILEKNELDVNLCMENNTKDIKKGRISISKQQEIRTKRRLEDMDLLELLDEKDITNIYYAIKIVDEYDFNREITSSETNAIIQSILSTTMLNQDRGQYIVTLIEKMKDIGLEIQQIYGMIINLAINNYVLEETGYSYTALLRNLKNCCKTIFKYKDKIQTEVTEETIQKAVKKANKPKKVKGQDIVKATMELTAKGSGGSQICDDVQADYIRLLEERTNNNQKEGSEQGGEN